jgi:hypothetical protein
MINASRDSAMTRPAANSAGCDARRAFSFDVAAAIYIG